MTTPSSTSQSVAVEVGLVAFILLRDYAPIFALAMFGSVLVYVLVNFMIHGQAVPGFAFLASIVALFSGAQLFSLGIIGEYLARVFNRSLDQPVYPGDVVAADVLGFSQPPLDGHPLDPAGPHVRSRTATPVLTRTEIDSSCSTASRIAPRRS